MKPAVKYHRLTKEQANSQGQIGYINANGYPISFMSSIAGRGMVTIEEGAVVRNSQSHLVAWDEDLENQVAEGLLRRILPNTSKYKELMAGEKHIEKQKLITPVPARTSAARPAESGDLPEGATFGEHGVINYQGKQFGGISGLHAFLDSAGR